MTPSLRAKKGICDGDCVNRTGFHEGVCSVVEVWGRPKQSWGTYSYCHNAIKCDERNGYTVEILEEGEYVTEM